MLLLLTGTGDGTSNLLCSRLHDSVFRLNYDIFHEYEFIFTVDDWEIKNPAGITISSSEVKTAFWWKAFNWFPPDADAFTNEETKYVFRELYNWCRTRKIVRGNPPDFHNSMGKLSILAVARRFFQTPKTAVLRGREQLAQLGKSDFVVKSLTSGLTTTNKMLFTTAVDLAELDPSSLWFLQEKIISPADVTVFICGSKLFAFERSRQNLKGLDWRAEQSLNMLEIEWSPLQINEQQTRLIKEFCDALGVTWGRIDFLLQNDELIFLEYNANGQFLFLDYQNKTCLHDAFIQYVTA